MWTNIPSLQEALADAELCEFRQPKGKRYELSQILLLACAGMMAGARSEQEIVDWLENDGCRWLKWLGIRNERGPSMATITRIFRGIDGARLEATVMLWSQLVLESLGLSTEEECDAFEIESMQGAGKRWAAGSELLSALSHRLQSLLDRLAHPSEEPAQIARRESLLAGLALTGYVETSDLQASREKRAVTRPSQWPLQQEEKTIDYIPAGAIPTGLYQQVHL